jgi:hypothetical protein
MNILCLIAIILIIIDVIWLTLASCKAAAEADERMGLK